MLRASLLAILLPVCAGAAGAGTFPARGEAFFDAELCDGTLWGVAPASAAARLGVAAGAPSAGLPGPQALAPALLRLWELERSSAAFQTFVVSADAWLLGDGRGLLGALARVPVERWDSYEVPANRRFGDPEKLHFTVLAGTGARVQSYIHIYRWRDAWTEFIFMKPTDQDSAAYWLDAETDTLLRVRLMQKAEDPGVPLFLGAFDRQRLRELRAAGEPPEYLVPLK